MSTNTMAGNKKGSVKEKGELKALLPQYFMYLDKQVMLPGFKIVAYTTIKTESGLRVALQVVSSNTCVCGGESYLDVTDIMSELISAGFKPVPVGISSDLPLRELPKNTVTFLRCLNTKKGLGNYLTCDFDGEHRPIPLMRYAHVQVPASEELTVIVDHEIPIGIFGDQAEAAVA